MEALSNFFSTPVIWFIVGLILVLLEFALPGVIIIFFGIGAWIVALLCAVFNLGINMQLFIFILASVILLITLRRYFKTVFTGKVNDTNAAGENLEDFVGKKAVVTKEIKNGFNGKVELNGANWEASADEDIEAGAKVEIVGKESIVLKVKTI